MADFDLIVIGSGPGGYVCAIRAAQLGLKTAVVESSPTYGGTCLNVGCIPSKALLESSELYDQARHSFGKHGIVVEPSLDLATMMQRKDKIVAALTRGVAGLFKKNGIEGILGHGRFVDAHTVEVVREGEVVRTISADRIVIATGSKVASIPGVELDGKFVFGSTEALALDEVPQRLGVIGAGVIGLEMGSVWKRLGSEVTVFEYLDRPLAMADADVCKQLLRSFKKKGFAFELAVAVLRTEVGLSGVRVTYKSRATGQENTAEFDKVLVAVGRRPNTDGLGVSNIGLELDKGGRVPINERFETNAKGVYAIGDVVRGPMLAHKASDEGIALAEQLVTGHGHINYATIPSVVYTDPEVAWVGKTAEQLDAEGTPYVSGKFPFMANGRAKALESTDGFVKLLAHRESDRILGAHMIGPRVGELIAEIVLAMEFGASAEDIARTVHAHPTLTEAVHEAALDAMGRVIHM